MKTLDLVQGSPEWLAVRAKHFTASEAAAMLGVSKYTTRTALLHAKATGLTEEINPATQRLFDAGHDAEAKARPLAEAVIGDELYPATGVLEVEGLPLLASFDGITMLEEVIWENKLWNQELAAAVQAGELEPHYWAQLEQQLLVSGAQRAYFTTSDGSEEKTLGCWYESVPARRTQLIAGWKQFAQDLAAYQPNAEQAPNLTGKAPETLPALRIEVTGMVTASNLAEFKSTALAAIRSVNKTLETDQDFADAEQSVKWCEDVETRLKAAKEHALSQTASIDQLFKAIDDISAEARQVRLDLEKLVKQRKEAIRDSIVLESKKSLHDHVVSLNATIGKNYMPAMAGDFAGAIKGKRTLASLRDAAASELARVKAEANAIADKLSANLKTLNALATDYLFLFADESVIVHKASDDLALLIKARIDDHQQAECEREEREQREAERKRLYEEAKKAVPMAHAELHDAAPLFDQDIMHGVTKEEPASRGTPTLRLGMINDRLGFTVTADLLATLGFTAQANGSARLYHEADFVRICHAIAKHVMEVAASAEAKVAG